MASAFDSIIKSVTKSVVNRAGQQGRSGAAGGLLGQLGSLLASKQRPATQKDVRPASEDPYGDPADQTTRVANNVKPASQDPYGDPADQERRRG